MRKNHKFIQLESGVDAIDGWCTLKRDDGRIVKVKKPRFWELFRQGRIKTGGKEIKV
jgi:hypothetical protein